jgi:hypothetical protein
MACNSDEPLKQITFFLNKTTNKTIMSFKAFKASAQEAVTRCGVTFEIKSVQKNFDGEITGVKGHVILFDNENTPIPQEMLWNLKGQAMLIGEQFDLVKEAAIEEEVEEEDNSTLLEVETIA